MHKLTTEEAILKIEKEELIDGIVDGAFSLVIEKYVPFVCVAIHNGSQLEAELQMKCNLDEKERLYEEDPLTGEFIESLPIRIIANDSRYEYDLNRAQEECVYEEAWGKKVWSDDLSKKEIENAVLKHTNFYKVLTALTRKVENKYNACIIYDVHSYNYQRNSVKMDSPIFNIGTEQINMQKYKPYLARFMEELGKIKFENLETTVAENEVFYGRGYLAKHIKNLNIKVLVIPLEIKKIYCDENTGDIFPEVVFVIKEGLKNAIIANSMYFMNKETNKRVRSKADLLSSIEDPVLKKVDKSLYSLLKNFETLNYVNPRNLEKSKKKFFNSKYRKEPDFNYIPLRVDPYELKKKLFELPVTEIYDVSVRRLYKDIINEYITTIDLLVSRGTKEFLYNSLKLYGKPDKNDVKNANYIIQSYGNKEQPVDYLSTEEVLDFFCNEINRWGIGGKVVLAKNMAARAMVHSSKKTLIINEKSKFDQTDLDLLSNHELGIHMLTTMNAVNQPLKMLLLGMPGNVETQEGLAVLAECLTGKMNIRRLKELSYRVIAVDLMVRGASFREIFEHLVDEYVFTKEKAFNLTVRVMRGGGFTKDHLYLKGFFKVYNYYLQGKSMQELLVGKTSLEYAQLLKELIARGYLKKGKYKNPIFEEGNLNNDIIEYILKSTSISK